jgi:hypothetical protein
MANQKDLYAVLGVAKTATADDLRLGSSPVGITRTTWEQQAEGALKEVPSRCVPPTRRRRSLPTSSGTRGTSRPPTAARVSSLGGEGHGISSRRRRGRIRGLRSSASSTVGPAARAEATRQATSSASCSTAPVRWRSAGAGRAPERGQDSSIRSRPTSWTRSIAPSPCAGPRVPAGTGTGASGRPPPARSIEEKRRQDSGVETVREAREGQGQAALWRPHCRQGTPAPASQRQGKDLVMEARGRGDAGAHRGPTPDGRVR